MADTLESLNADLKRYQDAVAQMELTPQANRDRAWMTNYNSKKNSIPIIQQKIASLAPAVAPRNPQATLQSVTSPTGASLPSVAPANTPTRGLTPTQTPSIDILKATDDELRNYVKSTDARIAGYTGPGGRQDPSLKSMQDSRQMAWEELLTRLNKPREGAQRNPAPDKVATAQVTQPAVSQSLAAPVAEPELQTIQAPLPTSDIANQSVKGPLKKEPDFWNQVGEIAKTTGKSILDVLGAAIAGRTAGLQGKDFNFTRDTLMGQELEQKRQDESERKKQDFELQLAGVNQNFQAAQSQIQQDFQEKMAAAKTDADKAAAQAEYAQRIKELQLQGQNALNLEAMKDRGAKAAAKMNMGSDPRGIGGF